MFSHHPKIEPNAAGISIKDVPEEAPHFKREYTATIHGRATIKVKITIRTYVGSVMKDGELTQPNGGWVLFDPNHVAEKILDPILVPQVQAIVDQVYAIDRIFRDTPPKQFIDERGTVWTATV